VAYDERDNMIE